MNKSNAFVKGMGDAPARHQVLIRKEIMDVLGISSRVQWANRRDGRVDHTPAERMAIESIFGRYGVKQPWGGK